MRTRNNRTLLFGALILLFTLVLSACGSGNDVNNETGGSQAADNTNAGNASASGNAANETEAGNAANTPASGNAETTVFKDALGREVTIPVHPQRVITTQYLPEMIAVGFKPVGAASHLLTGFTSIKDQIAGIEDIGAANEPNVEKMLALKPDLIIAAEWNKDQLDSLSKIAPTIVIQWDGKDAYQHMTDVAGVLGLSDKADEFKRNFDKKTEDARAKLAEYVKPGETFGVVVIGGYEQKQLRVYGSGNVGYTLFDALKFPMTDAVKTEWAKGDNGQGLSISLEKLPEFASADRLFLVQFDNDPDFIKEVDASSLWKNLPAVKNGKVYTLDDGLWFSYDVMSISAQLDDAVKLLAK